MNTTIRNIGILLVVLLVISGAKIMAYSAGDFYQDGEVLGSITWATTSPTKGDPVVKSSAKATGGIIGVAMSGAAVAGEATRVRTSGVAYLNVVASSTVGNMCVGDYVFGTVGGLEVCTTTLSNINSGIIFGQLLDAITASTTAGVNSKVRVKLLQPSHL